jgi:hypothetical protein
VSFEDSFRGAWQAAANRVGYGFSSQGSFSEDHSQ